MTEARKPLLIELAEDVAPAAPDLVGPVPDGADDDMVPPPAMARAARLMARGQGGLSRLIWIAASGLAMMILSLAAWDWVTRLLDRVPLLGIVATVLIVVLLVGLAIVALREVAAFLRLSRLDALQRQAAAALAGDDMALARDLAAHLARLYGGRAELRRAVQIMSERTGEQVDVPAVLALAEAGLMQPLDIRAEAEIEAAARQVAVVTAVVPLALADVAAALTANLRMIRRIAEIYGGRAGTFGSWRLTKTVMTHLVATGAVAVGDDLIGSVAGGSILSKLSRRFGEGVVNAALTARVGVAAMEVCRPLPFRLRERPQVTGVLRRALSGLFGG